MLGLIETADVRVCVCVCVCVSVLSRGSIATVVSRCVRRSLGSLRGPPTYTCAGLAALGLTLHGWRSERRSYVWSVSE